MNVFAKNYLNSVFHHSTQNNEVIVGIQVRRGTGYDYLNFWNFPPDQYFINAMQYFRKKYKTKKVRFVIASLDIEWCQEKSFFKDAHIIPKIHDGYEDLAVLSNCDHMILSVATYSWWAGFFNEGEVVLSWVFFKYCFELVSAL